MRVRTLTNLFQQSALSSKLVSRFLLPPLLLLLLAGCATDHQSGLRRNKQITQRYFDRWANHGDTEVADELITTNLVLHSPPAVISSLADYKKGMAGFHAAFPDLHFTIEDSVAEGDKVVVRWTLRGTQMTDYQGHPPSRRMMTVTGMSSFRIANGKIQEIFVNMDRHGMMEQLGWLPPTAPLPK